MLSPGHGNTTSAQKARKKSNWWLNRVKSEVPSRHCYLIYRYKGEIRVKEGWAGITGVFYPKNQPYTWMTQMPTEYNHITSSGRLLVKNENDILEGVEKLRDYYRKRYGNVCDTSNKTIQNITECINSKGYIFK